MDHRTHILIGTIEPVSSTCDVRHGRVPPPPLLWVSWDSRTGFWAICRGHATFSMNQYSNQAVISTTNCLSPPGTSDADEPPWQLIGAVVHQELDTRGLLAETWSGILVLAKGAVSSQLSRKLLSWQLSSTTTCESEAGSTRGLL